VTRQAEGATDPPENLDAKMFDLAPASSIAWHVSFS